MNNDTFTPRYPDLPRGCRKVAPPTRLHVIYSHCLDVVNVMVVLFVVWCFITVLLLGA